MLLLASCAFTRKHPKITLVSATTIIFSAGIGAPLSLDCDNPTSTCSGRHAAAVFGIGAAIGFGIGLVAVHELGIGKPAEQRPPPPPDVSLLTCNEARREAQATLENRCGEGGTVEPARHRECVCRRPKGVTTFECTLETSGLCHPKVGEDMTLHGTCVCSAAGGCACSMRS